MADWKEPTNSAPTHVNVLKRLAEKDDYAITMGQLDAGFTNIPNGAMKWDHDAGIFRRKDAATFEPVHLAVAGGGTGANSAAQARVNLGTDEAGNVTKGVLNAARVPTLDINTKTSGVIGSARVPILSITDKTSGTLPASRVDSASTSAEGVVQLNDTLTSTSTSEALTANQGRVLDVAISSKLSESAGDYRYLNQSSNLSDLPNTVTALGNLGVKYGEISMSSNSEQTLNLGSTILAALTGIRWNGGDESNTTSCSWSGSALTIRNSANSTQTCNYIAFTA